METEEGQSLQDVVKESLISLSRQDKTTKLYMMTYYYLLLAMWYLQLYIKRNLVYNFGS